METPQIIEYSWAKKQVSRMTRTEKVVAYVMGSMIKLMEQGHLPLGSVKLASNGRLVYRALQEEGFEPTEEEVNLVMDVIQGKVQ